MSSPFEPFKVDFSNFYKFVSSVGLVLIAAAAAVPWFVMRSAIPEAEPKTPAAVLAEQAMLTRAEQYLFALQAYPWVSGSLFVLGLLLTGYGLIAWRGRQKKQDADEDETFRQRKVLGETTKASKEERKEKLDSEADSSDDQDSADQESVSIVSDETVRPESDAKPEDEPQSQQLRRAAAIERRDRVLARIADVERVVGELLREAFTGTHEIERDVKIPSDDGRPSSVVDFVARAQQPERWTSFAVEVRLNTLLSRTMVTETVVRGLINFAIAARGVPEGQIQRGSRGRPMRARSVSLSVLVVFDGDDSSQGDSERDRSVRRLTIKRLHEHFILLNSILARRIGLLIISEASLRTSSAEQLRSTLVALMENPDQPFLDSNLE